MPDITKHLLRLCHDFPLWTNVMKFKFKSPDHIVNSAVVENDFKELKTQILKNHVRPMKADKFIISNPLKEYCVKCKTIKKFMTKKF